ncbi:MAG: hypothetical protein RJA98_3309 [Pseudomonadota bacterium]|jgi:hypothetical protein
MTSPLVLTPAHAFSAVAALLLGVLIWGASGAVQAATWRTFAVDDSLSQAVSVPVPFRWRSLGPSRTGEPPLEAVTDVRVVLKTSAWVGLPARIYMVMPAQPTAPTLAVQWSTRGLLLPGRLTGGQRQLVFQGAVPAASMQDALHVTASAWQGDAASPQRLNFSFEIEVQTP